MNHNTTLGNLGEKIALQFLQHKGYVILQKNWKHDRAEIDIIAQYQQILVFVEVKTRKNTLHGYPETAVDNRKIKQLEKASLQYIQDNDYQGEIRFDIIAIDFQAGEPTIQHFQDAFFPMN